MAREQLARKLGARVHFSDLCSVEHTSGNMSAMTRTPITTVTANAFAARAFAWGSSIGAHFSGLGSGTPPLH